MHRGRPRSEDARRAVLTAALQLCERDGYQRVTMKGIADAAGVGRQTVYRWWPAKADVLIEALRDLAGQVGSRLDVDTGDTVADVRTVLRTTFHFTRGVTGRALTGLMADAQSDDALAERLQGTVIGPRRDALRDILQRGIDRGELAGNVSPDLVVDLLFGTMWYRLLHRHAPLDAALADELAEIAGTLLTKAGSSTGQARR